jgi:hypothetical protein
VETKAAEPMEESPPSEPPELPPAFPMIIIMAGAAALSALGILAGVAASVASNTDKGDTWKMILAIFCFATSFPAAAGYLLVAACRPDTFRRPPLRWIGFVGGVFSVMGVHFFLWQYWGLISLWMIVVVVGVVSLIIYAEQGGE